MSILPKTQRSPDYPRIERLFFNQYIPSGSDAKRVSRAVFKNGDFVDANGKGITFERCDFSYCIFERAYFRDAIFQQCEFVGTRFIDCNFRQAQFAMCDLSYTEFTGTLLETRDVVASLPLEPNKRAEVIRSLKVNATSIDDHTARSFLVLQEIKNTEDHLKRALWGTDSYYKAKYGSFSSKVSTLAKLIVHWTSGLVWGHGEQPVRLVFSIVGLLLALAAVDWIRVLETTTLSPRDAFLASLRYVSDVFLGVPPTAPIQSFWFVDYLIFIARPLYLGLLVSVLFKQIGRR